MKTVIQCVREFIADAPALADGVLHVDFLPVDEAGYSIDTIPGNPVVKQYMDGSSKRQLLFVLASRQLYGLNVLQQLDNIEFFDSFQKWIEGKCKAKEFPNLGTGKKCTDISVTTYGYAFQEGATLAAYQIQMRIEYIQF